MSSGKQGIEAISVRRALLADADKVRYRVYTSPSAFIAVIAESALMAVKVSGVSTPYKIMRDLPTDGVAIEARKMAEIGDSLERVALRLHAETEKDSRITELEEVSTEPKLPFVPVGIADLRAKGGNRARILPSEMVNQIIEEHAKAHAPEPEPAVMPAPLPEEVHETILVVEPELTPAEKVVKLADELLPPSAPRELKPTEPEDGLSPEEVEKLLNGS